MDAETRDPRHARVRAALAQRRADVLLVPPSADFVWLTGAVARSTERLVALVLPRDDGPFCLVPRLEAGSLAQECPWLPLEVWDEAEDPLERLARHLDLERRPTLLVGEGFRVAHLLRLLAATACRPASEVMAPLRAVKDAEELRRLQEAAAHADRIVEETADHMRPGMTERRVARFAMERFADAGDTEPWAIVASGPNAALPHHQSSDRVLREGDVVVLDVGAYTRGYGSDITRTYWLGAAEADAQQIYPR